MKRNVKSGGSHRFNGSKDEEVLPIKTNVRRQSQPLHCGPKYQTHNHNKQGSRMAISPSVKVPLVIGSFWGRSQTLLTFRAFSYLKGGMVNLLLSF